MTSRPERATVSIEIGSLDEVTFAIHYELDGAPHCLRFVKSVAETDALADMLAASVAALRRLTPK